MANTDFRVLLKAVLDKSGINTELKEVQDILNKHSVDITPELKTASLRNQMKSISKEIANDFNKSFGTNLTGNDIFKAYENQAKKVTEQNKLVEKSFTDLRKNTYQSMGNKSPELQKMAEMYKQEAVEADKVAVSASKINQVISSGGNEAKIDQLTAKFRSLGLSTEEIQQELLGVNNAFNTLKGSSDNSTLVNNAKSLDAEYAKVGNRIKTLTADLKGVATESQKLSIANNMSSWADNNSKAMTQYGTTVNKMIAQLRSADDLTIPELKKIEAEFKNIQIQAREAGLMGKTLGNSFAEAGKKFASWITVSGGIMVLVSNLKNAVSELKDVNTILTEISKTNESLSKSDLVNLGSDAFDTAGKYGRKASDYLLGVQEASRAGYTNAEEVAELSTLAQSAGDMTAELSNQYLIATDAAYKLQGQTEKLNEVLDGQNYITNHNAASMSDLAEATKVAASQASSSGVAINEMTAAVGTMIATTQQGGDIAGRAFKAILMNVQQVAGTVDEETGEVVDEDQLTKYEKAAEDLGVKLKEVKNGYLALRDPMEVLKELSKAYTSLDEDDARRANLINAVGGKFRGNQLNALLENWDKYEKMLSEYSSGSGSAMEEASKSANNWEGALNRLSNTWTDTIGNIVKSDDVITLVNGLNDLLVIINNITSALGGFGTIATGIGLGAFIKNFQKLKTMGEAATAMKSFNSLAKLGTATNEAYAVSLKGVDAQTKINIISQAALSTEQKKAIASATGLEGAELTLATSNTALSATAGTATIATTGLGTAIRGLGAAMATNPLLLLITVIGAGISAWTKYKQSVEEARQATDEAATAFGEASKSIDEYADKYKDLHDKLVDANTSEKEQQEIKSQLLDLQTELNSKYGDEYGRLNLVTDAYKDQIDAIRELNKVAAQNYLLDNKKGIEDATKKMEKTRNYTLESGTALDDENNQKVFDIASKYQDRGIQVTPYQIGQDKGYTIEFNGNAEDADKVIRELSNELQSLDKEVVESNPVQRVLDNASKALKDNKGILDDYQNIYDQALMSQIAADDNLSEGYSNATNAVKEYNDAVTSGTPDEIQTARQNLNDVKNSIDLTSDEWKKYGNVMSTVFEQADTGIYDFEDALNSNQDDLMSYSESLRGLSKEDLLAMADDGQEDNFDKLIKSADKYGLSIDDVITELQKLKIIQSDVGKQTEDIFNPLSTEDTISNLESLTDGFSSLEKIMDNMNDKDNPLDLSLLNDSDFKETFGDYTEEYNAFLDQITNSPKDVEGAKDAFNNLATAWLDGSDALDGLTADNEKMAVSFLKSKGITNAEEVVASRLAVTQDTLAAKKLYTAEMSDKLSNATADEVGDIIEEATQSDIARVKIAGMALAKKIANGTVLSTDGDIENVKALMGIIGTATTAIDNYQKAKANAFNSLYEAPYSNDYINQQKSKNQLDLTTGLLDNPFTDNSVDKALKDYSEKKAKADSEYIKNVQEAIAQSESYTGQGANVNYGGGGASSNSGSGGGSGSSSKSDTTKEFDWTIEAVEKSQKEVSKLQDKLDELDSWKPKNKATDALISQNEEYIKTLQSQLAVYQDKLDKIQISPSYKSKIEDGTMEIEDITDEAIANTVSDYQDLYDKINDVKDKIDDVKKSTKELAKTKLDNIINNYESLVSLREKYASYGKNLLDLQEDLGEEIDASNYKRLINQQEDIYNQLSDEYENLSKQLSKAVSSGDIKIGTDEWRKYNEELIDINDSMNDVVSNMNDFRQSLIDMPFEKMSDFVDELDSATDAYSTLSNLIGDDGLTDKGMITSKGLAKIALYGQQYTNAKQKAAEYANAIEALNDAYEDGELTQEEYNKKINENQKAQLEAAEATKTARDAIVEFRKTAIQEQIDDYNELIEKKKEAMQEDKTYADYLDEVAEKQKTISNLQTKIDELSTNSDDSDRSAIAMRLQLENDLVDAKKDLADTQADYAYDQQLDSLDKQAEAYEDAKNDELDELESSYDAQQKVVEDYLGQVKDNYETVYDTLTQYGENYNVSTTEDLTSPWSSASSAVDTFQSAVSDAIAQINIDIDSIDLSKLTDMVSVMSGFSAKGGVSSYEDITGTGTWQQGQGGRWWYGSSMDDYASGGVYTIGGKQYGFDDEGYMLSGWSDSTGEWRYYEPENGQMVKSTWRTYEGKEYYLKSDGTMATDMAIKSKTENGVYYYVGDDGAYNSERLTYDQVKAKDIEIGYRNGTYSAASGLKYVGEKGRELIFTKDGTVLSSDGEEHIFTNEASNALMDFANDPTSYITDKLMQSRMDLSSLATVNRVNSPVSISFSNLFNGSNASDTTVNDFKVWANNWATKELPSIMQQNMKGR